MGGWGYFTALYLPQTALQYKQFSQNPWGMRLLSKSNIKTDIICSPSPISSNPYFFKLCLWWHFRNDVFIGERSIFRFFPLCFWNNQEWYRVLVSLISWPGQLLSLNPCGRPKILARMPFLGIYALFCRIFGIYALFWDLCTFFVEFCRDRR